MNRSQTRRRRGRQNRRVNRIMMLVFAAVLFIGLFSQVAMVARLSGQVRQSRVMEREIRDLSATVDNLNLSLNQYKSLDRVARQAEKLGMEQPSAGQIRVVSLPTILQDTSTQSAENIGAEEMQ